jgi:hypothetical protein
VAIHSRKCPAVKQLERFEKQTYFAKGINAGGDDVERTTWSGHLSTDSSRLANLAKVSLDWVLRRVDEFSHCNLVKCA